MANMTSSVITLKRSSVHGPNEVTIAASRMSAAEARRVLVDMAAEKLGVPADQLTVTDGAVKTIAPRGAMPKSVTYADLIGGKYFNVQLEWNKQYGNTLYAPGKAEPKDPKDHKIVGQAIKRADVAAKVFCQEDFCTDVKVPGMVWAGVLKHLEYQ